MDSKSNNNNQDFKSPDEAFEYLINQRLDEKRKKEWAEALGEESSATEVGESNKQKSSRTLYFRIASIAAGMVILFGAFWLTNDFGSSNKLMAQNYINETKVNLNYSSDSRAIEEGRAVDELSENIKVKLSEALLNEDFGQMLGIYRSFEKKSELSIKDKFYYAVCLLKLENEDKFKAIRLLDEVIELDKVLEVEALYFRGLANIELGNSIDAEIDLKAVVTKSDYKKSTISKILENIK